MKKIVIRLNLEWAGYFQIVVTGAEKTLLETALKQQTILKNEDVEDEIKSYILKFNFYNRNQKIMIWKNPMKKLPMEMSR